MKRSHRVLSSLISMFVAWAAGFGFFAGYMTCCTSSRRVTDAEAMLVWSAVFIFASWLLIALPVALWVAPSSRLFSLPIAPLLGAPLGAGCFTVLLSWSGLWREPLFLAYAAVVGAVAALAYSLLVHGERVIRYAAGNGRKGARDERRANGP